MSFGRVELNWFMNQPTAVRYAISSRTVSWALGVGSRFFDPFNNYLTYGRHMLCIWKYYENSVDYPPNMGLIPLYMGKRNKQLYMIA